MRERLNVVDCGDLVYAFGDAREMSEKLQAHAEKLLAAGNACSLLAATTL
ncbi:agmatinase [Klebsiella michiganensis]|nr:agmatinase [Klebsiella michiganensis]